MRKGVSKGLRLAVLFGSVAALAAENDLEFAGVLAAAGFAELAEKVLQRAAAGQTAAGPELETARIRILIARRRFEEAHSRIVGTGAAASLWLELAQAAMLARQPEAARAAYACFFGLNLPADEAAAEAAFLFGNLLAECGESAAAVQLYEQVLRTGGSLRAARALKVRLAQQIAQREPERARRLSEEVQLGGPDLWSGEALAVWSRVLMQQGRREDAQPVLESQLEILKGVERALQKQGVTVSSISPLAATRFTLGECYEAADRPADALHQFYNVYAQYGDSPDGVRAKEKADALIARFEAQGKTVQIDPGLARERLEPAVFRTARRRFSEGNYAGALTEYLDALARSPEGGSASGALRDLALCAVHQRDPLVAKAVAAYAAERFAGREGGADILLAPAKCALDQRQAPLAMWIYDLFFEKFPQDERVPAVRYSLAALCNGAEQEERWQQIVQRHPRSPYAVRALGRLAWTAFEQERFDEAARRFDVWLREETDWQSLVRARFARAESLRRCGENGMALAAYGELDAFLQSGTELAAGEAALFIRPFQEKSLFYQGTCLRWTGDPGRAAERFDTLLQRYPDSALLLQVQLLKGCALTEAGRHEEALAALAGFGDASPRELLESALFFRAQSQFETGRPAEAVQALETLLGRWPDTARFCEAGLLLGRACMAAGRSAEAVRALGDVLDCARDPVLIQRAAVELGRAQTDPSEKLASFQRVALLADPADEAQVPLIAAALFESLPLYLELSRPRELLADSERLVAGFPSFGRSEEIGRLCAAAREMLGEGHRENGG